MHNNNNNKKQQKQQKKSNNKKQGIVDVFWITYTLQYTWAAFKCASYSRVFRPDPCFCLIVISYMYIDPGQNVTWGLI